MKILHVSDTHLGYSAYRKVTEDGVNQREIDTYRAFEQFVDYAQPGDVAVGCGANEGIRIRDDATRP